MTLPAAALGILIATSVARADDADTLRREADRARAANTQLAAAHDRAALELFGLEQDLERARDRADTLGRDAGQAASERRLAGERLSRARETAITAQDRLAQRLRDLYMSEDPDPLELVLAAGSVSDVLAALDGLEQVVDADVALLDDVYGARRTLRDAADDARARLARARELVADARTQARLLDSLVAGRRAYVDGLGRELRIGREVVLEIEREAKQASERAAAINAQAAPAPVTAAPASTSSEPADAAEPSPAAPPADVPANDVQPAPAATTDTPNGDTSANRQTMQVEATAYALHGTTATGVQTQHGIVAVDPTVIPLGTRMTVPGYGEAIAADTGSAVKGAIIDVWLPTVAEALQWGRKTITITLYR